MSEQRPVDQLDGTEPAAEAVARLFEAHGGRLHGMARRFCGNEEEARDLVQETFLQAWRNWEGFEGRSQPTTWLYTIARRACQRMHRKRAGEPEHLDSLDVEGPFGQPSLGVASPEAGPLDLAIREEAKERIEAAIAELPMDFRMPLVLKEIAGLSIAEIAAATDIPAATVKTRLHRARLAVRQALESALPKSEIAPARFSRQVCADLLQAKQAALDAGEPFRFPDDVVCERCSTVFEQLDLGQELCGELAQSVAPNELLARVRELADSSG